MFEETPEFQCMIMDSNRLLLLLAKHNGQMVNLLDIPSKDGYRVIPSASERTSFKQGRSPGNSEVSTG